MVRGCRGVLYNRAKYLMVQQQDDSIIWRCPAVFLHRRCRSTLTTTLCPELRVLDCSNHSFAFCPSSIDSTENASPSILLSSITDTKNPTSTTPSSKSNQQTPSKRRRLENQPTKETVTSFTTQRGKRGLKVGAASFKFIRMRKSDNLLVWRCCRCQCSMATTESLSIMKLPQHNSACNYGSVTPSPPSVSNPSTTSNAQAIIESSSSNVSSFTTKRGQKGLKVDGVSFRLGNVRKSDGVMVWRCCRCHCTLESTANLKIIKTSDHKSASCRPIPPAPDALHADTVPRPHFVETQKKKTALVFEKNLYYKDTDKLWRCSYRKQMNFRAACSIMDNKVISNNVPHVHGPLSEEEIKMFDVIAEAKTKAVEQPDEKPLHIISYLHEK